MKHLTKSDEENYELDQLSHDFCYHAVKYSDLWHLLPTNEACDQAADELMKEVREFVIGKIDQRIDRIEAEREAQSTKHWEAA